MTGLLEIREKIKFLYSRYEIFILPVIKFLLAFLVLNTLNGQMGYMTRLDNIAIVLIVALMCSFLPTGCIILFATLFSLLHMYALSMEVALVGLCVYLVMFLLFFRFAPRDSLVVVLTPLLFAMKIPYVVPLVVGLTCSPVSIVSVGCGICVHFLFQTVIDNAPAVKTLEDSEIVAKIRLIIDGIVGNKSMMVMIAAFAIAILVVYLIRRMSVGYAWTIAMVSGAMTNIVVLLVGDLLYDINVSVGGVLLGSVLGLAVAKVVELFRFCVDYNRTEKVQFEDDEYYYYVKAIPKMTVAVSTKTVKKINSQSQHARTGTAAGAGTRQTGQHRPVNVTTEHTPGGRKTSGGTRSSGRRRSVTVGNTARPGSREEQAREDLF